MKLCITDIETSSLDHITGEILEIGFIIADSETFKIYGKFNFKTIPEHIETASKKALEVNGYDPNEWKDAIPLKQALEFFAKASDGCIFMGQNPTFDWGFIEVGFNKYNIKHQLNYHKLDSLSMAYIKIPHDKMQSWSLKSICTYLKIPPEDKVHRSISGAEKCYEVYKELMK